VAATAIEEARRQTEPSACHSGKTFPRSEKLSLLLKNLLFTLIVPGTVAVYVPLWLARGRVIASGVSLAVGAPVLALGAVIYLRCVWDFGAFGRGTPLPIDAPRKLVVRGIYRYTRNPMYLAVLAMLLGWTILYRSAFLLPYAALVATCVQLFVVLYEEPHLRRRFGREYEEYCARVGRWLPRLGGRKPL
jgi:protein-S-isoprenylcysteine O-methyltransferase Ste14